MAKVHFEDLWDKSEKASSPLTSNEMEILGKISSVVDEIKDIYTVGEKSRDKQLLQGMKSKAIGRLVMNIAALSAKENIDVYAALKDQLEIIQLRDKITF
jgi:hypothetical protein